MDAATFIFYLIILYSIINPLKEFSRAFYNIPQGLASMERIDMILKAENHIVEPEQPLPLDAFTDKLEFKNVSFCYVEGRPVLNHINLTVLKENDCTGGPVRFRKVYFSGLGTALSRCIGGCIAD